MKKRVLLSIGLRGGAALAFFLVLHFAGRQPFGAWEAAEIESATVLLNPPGQTVPITETQELAALLRDVVIYEEDCSYTEYCGQGVLFTIEKTDGAPLKVMAYNPFIVIDNIAYRTKYAPCQALNAYANRLLRQSSVP